MSRFMINQYLGELNRLRRISGATRETVVREAFKDLLKTWGRSLNLTFIPEHEFISTAKVRSYVDGALMHDLRVPFGYWEAKDEHDDLDEEIAKKFRRGYPQTNIIFEDTIKAVLIQNRSEVMRCAVDDVENLGHLLELFFGYQRPEIADFRKAVSQFKTDLPQVLNALRGRIDMAYRNNAFFSEAARDFLKHAKKTINPAVTDADLREMLIQHILTEDIFARVFGKDDFHQDNNVAKALYTLEAMFFRGDVKQQTLRALEPYYAAIRSTAALISSHSEKQGFLKAIYENFYKVYNPKAADRLGVVYTPNEIVRFMVESADWLCEKHFGKSLIDRNVEILDPATGTGTFVVELLEHFRGRPQALKYKYLNELHANEVAILPYYVANLNIEATYATIIDEYTEFPNLCFVDTLDNTAALKLSRAVTGDLFGAVSEENVARIRRQNRKKISVIIGNPPYNANQNNENDNNKNRVYPEIDRRIRATYIQESTAQKTKLYDMYSRFFRWASDRIEDDGIVAFVTNRGFLDKRNFDGFRKLLATEFNDIYVVDLGGDVRDNPKLSGTTHNVFGIQIGVAISFLVKRRKASGSRIHYGRRPEFETKDEKLVFLHNTDLERAAPELIRPDAKHNWLNLTANDFGDFLPLATKGTKTTKLAGQEQAIFKLFSLGVVTNRDDWVYDRSDHDLTKKVKYLIDVYNQQLNSKDITDGQPEFIRVLPNEGIKWTRLAKLLLAKQTEIHFSQEILVNCTYRPFQKLRLYFSKQLNEMQYRLGEMFGPTGQRRAPTIVWSDPTSQKPFMCLAVDGLYDLHLVGAASGAVGAARTIASSLGNSDNVTDWAVAQFTAHYGAARGITKLDIFAYVYAVLHDPVYRDIYGLNLKQEFPRIPLYSGFWRWRDWGQILIDLHIGYQTVKPFPLVRTDVPDTNVRATRQMPRVILKADKVSGIILLDAETSLGGVPRDAWDYRLGNRSALDWVLDQHKEKTPRDPTIREKFNTYRFADHKDAVIDLLRRVTTVSVKTVEIVETMRSVRR
jgi:predicted helicase